METKTIYQKLLEFQTSVEIIKKDGKNPFFKKPNGKESTYATLPHILSEVKPILNALKMVITQPIINNEVLTVLTCTETGESVSSGIPLTQGLSAQQTGSAITYFSRYTLCKLLALEIEEDDDGNMASQKKQEPAKKFLNIGTKQYAATIEKLKAKETTLEVVKQFFNLSPETEQDLIRQTK